MDEAFFQLALDDLANDGAARWLLAEWLSQRGDERSAGYAWMARFGKRPLKHNMMWRWWTIGMTGTPSAIDARLEPYLDGHAEKQTSRFSYRSRIEAECAVGRALHRCEESRQAAQGTDEEER